MPYRVFMFGWFALFCAVMSVFGTVGLLTFINLFAALSLITIVGMVIYAFMWFRNSSNAADSMLDDYLRGREGNDNPPHIPPTYSPSVFGGDRRGEDNVGCALDDPKTQLKKYKDSRTTTQAELEALRASAPE